MPLTLVAPSPASCLKDLLMMTTFGAKERTLEEFQTLFEQANLQLEQTQHIEGPHHYLLLKKL